MPEKSKDEIVDQLARLWLSKRSGMTDSLERELRGEFKKRVLMRIISAAYDGDIEAVRWLEDRRFINFPPQWDGEEE